jgi:hypothetical protein
MALANAKINIKQLQHTQVAAKTFAVACGIFLSRQQISFGRNSQNMEAYLLCKV